MVSIPQLSTPKPCIHLSPPPPYVLRFPSRFLLLDLITRILSGEDYRSLSSTLCSFIQSPVTSSLLLPVIPLSILSSNTLSLSSSLNVSDQVSHPYKTTGKIIFQYTLIFIFSDNKLEDKIFCTEWQQAFSDYNLLLISSWTKFWFVKVVLKFWTVPPIQRNYYQTFHCNFVLHYDLETWFFTSVYQHLLLFQSP